MIEINAKIFTEMLSKNNINENELQTLAVEALLKYGKKAATAESCTGGLISKRITEVSGSSAVFECGVCSYSNRIKHKILGVKESTLNSVGAVSPETAAQMAQGIRKLADADFGVSSTGIAGPTGGTAEKPVGLVYMAISDKDKTIVIKGNFSDADDNSREGIRRITSSTALFYLLKMLKGGNFT